MKKELLKIVQMASRDQPAWLQKKRSLALILQERFSKAEQQQEWLTKWENPSLEINSDDSALIHDGDDYVALPINLAVQKYPELLQENLMEKAVRWQENQLNAIHLALMDVGQFIYVPDNTELKSPLELGLVTKSNNPHNLIIVGAGAKVSVVEESRYETEQPIYAATEILMGTGAQVKFYQDNHYQSDFTRQAVHAYQARESVLNIEGIIPAVSHNYNSFYSFLDGSNAHWNVKLASLVNNESQRKVTTQVDGYGEGTSADVKEWGWKTPNSQLEWGRLATVDGELLELHQQRVVASNKTLFINNMPRNSENFSSAHDFFEEYLPIKSWLMEHC